MAIAAAPALRRPAIEYPDYIESVDELLIATRPEISSLFQVSSTYWDWIQGKPGVDSDEVKREVERLARLGFLVPPNSVRRPTVERSLVLHLVHGCNLSCTYCNVKGGTFGEQFQLMPFDVARRAIDRFVPVGASVDVTLFGGEPLMNWPVLIRTVEYGHSLPDRSIHWMVVTNGTLLTDDRAKELARLGIEVAVSVDGDRADHNRSRPTRGGNGSYDAVVSGVSALLRAKARLSLHSTHDGDGGSYQERFDHLTRLGQGRAAVVVAPETGSGQYRRGFGEQNRSWGSRLRSEWRAGRRTLPGYVSPMVSLILCGEHAQRQDCPAGSGLVDVTPSGEIFACHVSAARKQYRLGHLDDKLLAHVDPLGRAPMPKACTRCWANGLCSHGCPIRRSAGLEPSNDECETYREPIRCAAYFLSIASFDDVAQLWSLDANERRSLGRAWAVREMLRFQHRHIKPLSVFPALPTA